VVTPDQLVGAWRLESWVIVTGDRRDEPFGADATGLLTYTADGAMQATICAAGRIPYSGTSARRSSDAEVARAARSFFSYAGTWHLDDEEVVHDVTLALDPGFVGSQQRRHVALDADRLVLSADEPVGGQCRHHRLTWRRRVTEPAP
jgi:hypothetical protein